ncbi:MAG: HAD family acid phosphatase [Planctomycetaceae bacterium]
MIPGNLLDVFVALTLGLLTLGIGTMILWVFDRNHLTYTKYVRDLSTIPPGNFWGVVFVLGTYGFGLLIEDFTDHLTDTDTEYAWYDPQLLQQRVLKQESEHRFWTLFKRSADGTIVPTGLGEEVLADESYVSKIAGDYPFEVEDGKLNVPDDFVLNHGYDYVNPLYYDAKNWCYRQDNYFTELERIQDRIDFSRSCFLVASWGLFALFIFTLIDCITVAIAQRPLPYAHMFRLLLRKSSVDPVDDGLVGLGGADWKNAYDLQFWTRLSKFTAFLILVLTLGLTGYFHAEQVFNERAFGYHVSWRKENANSTTNATPSANAHNEETNPQVGTTNAFMWMRTSGEYAAICQQVYLQASGVIAETTRVESAKPWAVVLDLDETVLDNSSFNALLFQKKQAFDEQAWECWLTNSSSQVREVPGSSEFVNSLPEGVHVIFISNRSESSRKETIETLVRLNLARKVKSSQDVADAEYWQEHLLLKSDTSSKHARRAAVESNYSVAAFIGDNLADLSDQFEKDSGKKAAERRADVLTSEKIGSSWFVLPNPMYGDWQRDLDVEDVAHTATQ